LENREQPRRGAMPRNPQYSSGEIEGTGGRHKGLKGESWGDAAVKEGNYVILMENKRGGGGGFEKRGGSPDKTLLKKNQSTVLAEAKRPQVRVERKRGTFRGVLGGVMCQKKV